MPTSCRTTASDEVMAITKRSIAIKLAAGVAWTPPITIQAPHDTTRPKEIRL